jgi:hypothetical protein
LKKYVLSSLLLLTVFYGLYSQEVSKNCFEYKLNYGSFVGGMNFFSNEYDFKLSTSLINFFAEHDRTNIGIELSPLKYAANYSVSRQEWNQHVYFLNENVYWNVTVDVTVLAGIIAALLQEEASKSGVTGTDDTLGPMPQEPKQPKAPFQQ